MNQAFLTNKAYAKINLALDVLYKRPDGYHEVAMVMQSIGLADTVRLRKNQGISLTVNHPDLPQGPGNLAYAAAELICRRFDLPGAEIEIEKNIPLAAGLAGGSTDAAAVLKLMNQTYQLGLSFSELSLLAAQLGSDVPFCLEGGTQLAYGRGEKLRKLPDLPKCWVVLAKLPLSVSTAGVYSAYDAHQGVSMHPDLEAMEQKLGQSDLPGIAKLAANVLESVTLNWHPEVERLKQAIEKTGVLCSLMSGSGPTVFALLEDRCQAERTITILKSRFRAEWFIIQTVQSQE